MNPEQYLISYGWKRGRNRWSHPNQHGWFSTDEAVQAQLDLRQKQLSFELGFGGHVDQLIRALESLHKRFPKPIATAGYPSRYEAVSAYVAEHPEAKAVVIGRALNIPTRMVYKLLDRRKRRLAKQAAPPPPPPPKVLAAAATKRTTPAKVARLTGVPLHVARAAVDLKAKKLSRAEAAERRSKRVLPMLLGPGERREDCAGYETCVDRAARILTGEETVHCPAGCSEFEAIDRKGWLNTMAMTQPL